METSTSPNKQYNSLTHIIDKGITNFIVGFAMAISIAVLILQNINGSNCFPFVFFLIILGSLIYAFGGMGLFIGSTKEKVFKVNVITAIAGSIVSSFLLVFPVFFIHLIFIFIIFLMPKYTFNIMHYIPQVANMTAILRSSCKVGEFCFYNSNAGQFLGNLLDALLIATVLVILFSVVNSVTATFKVISK